MERFVVAVPEEIDSEAVELLAAHAAIIDRWPPRGNIPDPTVDGVIVRLSRVTRSMLEMAPRLRVIGKHGVGLDNIDLEGAAALGVRVVYTPATTSEAVAEFTVLQLLALARRLKDISNGMSVDGFVQARRQAIGRELRGRVLGIVGYGNIGRRVGEICRLGFGMRVLAFDPYLSADTPPSDGIEVVDDLANLLKHCEFLTIHVPGSATTDRLIGEAELSMLPTGACLINCARGGIVDEEALVASLSSGHLAGAAIDVFADEPPDRTCDLLQNPRVLSTPHIAGTTMEALRDTGLQVVSDVLSVLRGEEPRYPAESASTPAC